MQPIFVLKGDDIRSEKEFIENKIKEFAKNKPIFLLEKEDEKNAGDKIHVKLCDYIDSLHGDFGLKVNILYQLRICHNLAFNGNITLYQTNRSEPEKPSDMEELLGLLQKGSGATFVFENDSRKDLADVLQQLVYINYPITDISLKLRKEFKDAERTRAFMQNIKGLSLGVKDALGSLKTLKKELECQNRMADVENVDMAIKAYTEIEEKIEKASNLEMKVAVVASKKTGKTVLVNCMLEQELAPTSLETATPNTCIYKRSRDNKYHMQFDHELRDYDNPKDLCNDVRKKFIEAQNSPESGYLIPDMTLEYVSAKENFDDYTIFDTPGPDAASTDHYKSSNKALEDCDVAIFMIDYGKYLTGNEVEWLENVKDIFASKGKFHTLIFSLNQIDRALQDKGSKSRIKSVDFIRNRLREIDEKYQDCVIFSTSALDFFYTCELEHAADNYPELQELLQDGQDWATALAAVKGIVEDDDDLTTVVTNLRKEAVGLNDLLKINPAGLKEIREYSGIPQLLSYAKSVMQSKARDEIINDITSTIDSLSSSIKTIIAKSDNLRELMSKSQVELQKISNIMNSYKIHVESILHPHIAEDEYNSLEKCNLYITAQIDKLRNDGGSFPFNFNTIIEEMAKDETRADSGDIGRSIFKVFSERQADKIYENRGKRIENINSLCLSHTELNRIGREYIQHEKRNFFGKKLEILDKLRKDLTSILKNRLRAVEKCTEDCKKSLLKENCELTLPEMPAWDIALPSIKEQPINMDVKINLSSLDGVFDKLGEVHQFFRNVMSWNWGRTEYDVKELSKEEIKGKLEIIRGKMDAELQSVGLREKVQNMYDEVNDTMKDMSAKLLKDFSKVNKVCGDNISIFSSVIDDREKFVNDINAYQATLGVFTRIDEASSGFLTLWDEISGIESKPTQNI